MSASITLLWELKFTNTCGYKFCDLLFSLTDMINIKEGSTLVCNDYAYSPLIAKLWFVIIILPKSPYLSRLVDLLDGWATA